MRQDQVGPNIETRPLQINTPEPENFFSSFEAMVAILVAPPQAENTLLNLEMHDERTRTCKILYPEVAYSLGATPILLLIPLGIGIETIGPRESALETQATTKVPRATSLTGHLFKRRKTNR